MDIEEIIKEILEDLLKKLDLQFSKIEISEEENKNFHINITSDNPSHFIGYHGENIQAIQHILKALAWAKISNETFNILLDVDNYRKRQEENIISLATRKISQTRKTGRPQALPPVSAYLRRKVHMICMGAGFEDIETYSEGEGEKRHLIIKLK